LAGKFGSLQVGVYEGDKLRFAGKVGAGFTEQERTRVGRLLDDLATDASPFDPPPPRDVSRTAHWVRPALVAEVTFAEWTTGGTLRHPSYVATRDDKEPTEVVREAWTIQPCPPLPATASAFFTPQPARRQQARRRPGPCTNLSDHA
jgi:bifunctional non-homologous end joining protein LigD